MSYIKTKWVNGQTRLNASNMNKIEDELEKLDTQGGGGIKEIPVATENIVGGIKASSSTSLDTVECKINPEGFLVVPESRGPQGPKGDKGDTGSVGPQGPRGPEGPQGNIGTQGPEGKQGDIGPEGPQGLQGPEGKQGQQGIQGPKGDKGDTGPQGPRGPQGIEGPKGDRGEVGPRGPQGDIGPQGPQGPRGLNGNDFEITGQVNSISQLPSASPQYLGVAYFVGSSAPRDVYWCNGSTWLNQGKLQGPKGDKGDTGPQGPKGLQGIEGKQGPEGPQGPRGLQGPEGPQGPKGVDGSDGLQGPEGKQGQQGIQGPKGDKGDTGPQGPRGLQGPQGIQGPKGDNGKDGTGSKRYRHVINKIYCFNSFDSTPCSNIYDILDQDVYVVNAYYDEYTQLIAVPCVSYDDQAEGFIFIEYSYPEPKLRWLDTYSMAFNDVVTELK